MIRLTVAAALAALLGSSRTATACNGHAHAHAHDEVLSRLAGFHVSTAVDAFIATVDACVEYVNLTPPHSVTSVDECAAECLAYNGTGGPCISFNVCNSNWCGIQGYHSNWTIQPDVLGCVAFQRLMPRNDTRIGPAVPWKVTPPAAGVALAGGGMLAAGFETNIQYLLNPVRKIDDALFPYRIRHDPSWSGPGSIWAWDDFVPGSTASVLLMGTGGVLRWVEQPALRALQEGLVAGIAAAVDADGFAVGYPEPDTASYFNGNNQNPSYVNSWFFHGMLEASYTTPSALPVARGMADWWNNNTYLPQLFPTNSGPDAVGPPVNGWDPANNYTGTQPFASGHLLYWMQQAGIGHTRMALSSVGTQADVDFMQNLFREDWWLSQLIARNPEAIYLRKYNPDNYEVTVLEAYMDLHTLTGNSTYLDAVLGGWALFRDPVQGWMFPGGSFAINEMFLYKPGSFHLEYTAASGGWGVNTRPTGEMCPSAFWIKLNQRLHQLDPDNETLYYEIERSLINIALAAQGANGTGVRYFANLHKNKQVPILQGSCCEGQNTRIFGAVPELIYSIPVDSLGVYVNLFEPSSITLDIPASMGGGTVNVTLNTDWPAQASGVQLQVTSTSALPAGAFDLAIRLPQWAALPSGAAELPITVNGAPYPTNGAAQPGTYLHLKLPLSEGAQSSSVSFALNATLRAHLYTGETQLGSYSRYTYMLGPILLAAESISGASWDSVTDCLIINATSVSPPLDPMQPADWMLPLPGQPLTFLVAGVPDIKFVPYYPIQDVTEIFTTWPIFIS